MGDIFGHPIPTGGVKGRLVAVALVSIPVAVVLGVGYGARTLYRRWTRPETDDEILARLEKAAYRNGIPGDR